ncbi:NADH-quinone oxidoreductase subunit C [Microcystis elabens FACHB-917]|nr:NADH-quinone oxidoreductase subunit C [Microcystis elabens FACHB-917]
MAMDGWERETFDMFDISFGGKPHPKPLLIL